MGGQHEYLKVIALRINKFNKIFWIFQDDRNPPHTNVAKYFKGEKVKYSKAIEISGDNRGGREKILTAFPDPGILSLS
ncbi:hypothetical protein [Photorhabdus temperata]|uniref:hypothetical protein n=1 Tax=Photorhabdus temperata TaxID=574560 RepID=UPI00038A03BE|nr:hypothetical protein [Photorhabdus temperata]EQC01005.1 hypothetical protein B738_06909 [Photorhabdus temperata subsp. temperata M1021]